MRKSLNELTEKTFGFSFENWYTNNFWGDKCIPQSLVDDDKVVANVSVNIMDFDLDGTDKHYIQIGTVNIMKIQQVNMDDEAKWEVFFKTVSNSASNDRFTMNNPGLIAFWTRWISSVYYLDEQEAYIIADVNGDDLVIKQIIASHKVNLETVISSFGDGKEIKISFFERRLLSTY